MTCDCPVINGIWRGAAGFGMLVIFKVNPENIAPRIGKKRDMIHFRAGIIILNGPYLPQNDL